MITWTVGSNSSDGFSRFHCHNQCRNIVSEVGRIIGFVAGNYHVPEERVSKSYEHGGTDFRADNDTRLVERVVLDWQMAKP